MSGKRGKEPRYAVYCQTSGGGGVKRGWQNDLYKYMPT